MPRRSTACSTKTASAGADAGAGVGEREVRPSCAAAQKAAQDKTGKVDGKPQQQQHARPVQEQARELRNWWVEEMLVTDQPLVERMTLFWHNHFTSSLAEGEVRAGAVSAERAVPPRGVRQFRPAPEGRRPRSGDADLSRRRALGRAPAQRELRPRAARALHPGRGPLQRGRHQERRARLHRLVDRPRDRRISLPSASSTTPARRPSSARPATSTATTSSPSCCGSRAPPRPSSRSCGANSSR